MPFSWWRLRETGGEKPAANRRPKMLQLKARFDSRSSFGHQYSSGAQRLGDNTYEVTGQRSPMSHIPPRRIHQMEMKQKHPPKQSQANGCKEATSSSAKTRELLGFD
ncbi:hypothetical protein H0G86_003300 [Trichoderma simmonsii]|uniref:Uncharacterized protein n=1 Tax=Trichoderma simmonsii TaxID=1491479 RepID=A0A8G0L9Z8_9HYPO|nr:hypothetical protein H0G86_003300 [Trichoderma simmonsii]